MIKLHPADMVNISDAHRDKPSMINGQRWETDAKPAELVESTPRCVAARAGAEIPGQRSPDEAIPRQTRDLGSPSLWVVSNPLNRQMPPWEI